MKSQLSLLSLLVAVGCAANNPAGDPNPLGPDAAPVDDPEFVRLEIDPTLASTPWESIPITGKGPANGLVIYHVPARGQRTANLGTSGEFCIDVPLLDGDNSIRFEAVSEAGTYSEAEVVSVRREGEPPEPTPVGTGPIEIGDRTAGASYFKNADGSTVGGVSVEVGSFAGLVDNNTAQLVKMSGSYFANEAVAFKLSERMSIHGFEVTVPAWGGETCGVEAFEMWISDQAEPRMEFDGLSWVKVAEQTKADSVSGGGEYDLRTTIAGMPARYFAIMMTDASCGWTDNIYGVNEIRVLAETEGVTELPTNTAPSCATGGF